MAHELTPSTALDKLWTSLDKSPFVMVGMIGTEQHSEPLTAYFEKDHPSRLYFFLKKDNRLMHGLTQGRAMATATYQSKGHDLFACLHGELEPVTNPEIRDRFWSKNVEAWFEGGKQDPKLQMLAMNLHDAELWDADLSVPGKLKMAFGGTIDAKAMEDKHVKTKLK